MKNDLVDIMSKSVGKDVAVFQKFLLEYDNYNNTLFYFVEGEDFCYYQPRIKQYTKSIDVVNYRCDGKHNVIGVYELIKKKLKVKKSNAMMFFVDRDYNFDNVPTGIYVTDFYSIENFYLNKDTIKEIIENFMEINKHSDNYKCSLNYFKKTYSEYSKFAVRLNAFYYTIREYEKINGKSRADLGLVKFSKFIEEDSLDNFSMLNFSYEQLLKMYKINYDIPLEQFKKNELLFDKNNHKNFRGKFELDYLKWFLNRLRIAIKEGKYDFNKDIVCNYDFCVDVMKVLSIYAYTPLSLKEYIIQNISSIINSEILNGVM